MIQTNIEERFYNGKIYYVVFIYHSNKIVGSNKFYDKEKAEQFAESMKKARWLV